jgi:hypothetical protein
MPKRKSFPHPVSAWWIAVLLGIGWLPLFAADVVLRFWPHLNDRYQLAAFGMAWGFDVAFPSIVLAGISILIQIVRLAQWEMHQGEPKE